MPDGLTASVGGRRRERIAAEQAWRSHVVDRVFPVLVEGVWASYRPTRVAGDGAAPEAIAERVRDGAVAWLHRLLLLFHADARGKLPASREFARLRSELARIGGEALADVERNLTKAFRDGKGGFGSRVQGLLAPFERALLSEAAALSDDRLALVLDGLSRIWPDRGGPPQTIDYARRTMREWGSAYECLLGIRWEFRGSKRAGLAVSQAKDSRRRKAAGCFYTPDAIVAEIAEHAVGSTLDARLAEFAKQFHNGRRLPTPAKDIADRRFEFSVLDPSSGAGYFLIAARRVIVDRLLCFLRPFPDRRAFARSLIEVADAPVSSAAAPRRTADWVERFVVERCLFGIDLDPRAVELTRLHLWLESPLEVSSLEAICRNVRPGDALAEPHAPKFPGAGQFDAVVGNPPYGGRLDAAERRALARKLPLMKANSDTAVGFVERASEWLRPAGRAGLVMPKPLTYSHAWRGVRAFLHGRVERLIDVSLAWPEVRLEQAIVIFRGAARSATYRTGWSAAGRIVAGPRISWSQAERFRTLPCALTAAELRRAARLKFADEALGDVCRTFRGIPAQRWLAERGETPVIGGRDLERWRIRGARGYLHPSAPFDLGLFACAKLTFQNIIAHATRPEPHVQLIGAYDVRQTVTLDTVNNLVATDPRVDLRGLCALLHSKPVNWLVYSLVYNKAIRTMHFDQYFLNKIPLPPAWPELLARLAAPAQLSEWIAETLAAPKRRSRGAFLRVPPSAAASLNFQRQAARDEIDRLVAEAYGDELQS